MKAKSFAQIADILAAVDITCYAESSFPNNVIVIWRNREIEARRVYTIDQLNTLDTKNVVNKVIFGLTVALYEAVEDLKEMR